MRPEVKRRSRPKNGQVVAPVEPRPPARPPRPGTAGTRDGAGSGGAVWSKRPAGVPAVVPPPWLPLSFLAVAAAGLVALGAALVWAAGDVVAAPMSDRVIGAAQFGTLAVLSMAVLGALHQFGAVVSQRPLRSLLLAKATLVTWFVGAWLVPIGLAARIEAVVAAGGAAVSVAVLFAVANLSYPLSARGKGTPVMGLRLSLLGFVATAGSGAAFIADRSGHWWDLSGHVVLAHAVLGVFFWVGLAYIAVAEKLWPMFLLAHIPGKHRSGTVAIWATAGGVSLLSAGIWSRLEVLGWLGGAVLAVGLGSHLVSMVVHIRNRRRGKDLHLAFVVTTAFWFVVGSVIAPIAATVDVSVVARERLVGASIAAFAGALLVAIVGHAHKVVPFISWTALRSVGVRANKADGRPLLFADLYDRRAARLTYALINLGVAGLGVGLLAGLSPLIVVGGAALALTGAVAGANLSIRSARLRLGAGASR